MPIKPIILQRRHAELGRIRLGHKTATQNGGTRPAKLAAFRFTSPSQRYIDDLATLYGGTPQPWDNNGKPEFEVFTDAKSIPVIAIKGGLSQWLETWSGGGCIHRCDGETNVLTGEACDPEDRAHRDAKPTTRLSVMLPELEAIGAWRMESKGWNAAAEIPAVAELAQFVGDMVPAHLNLVERRSVKDGKTSRFVVPVLDLHIGTARLREIVAAKAGIAELPAAGGAGGPAAIAAPAAADPYADYHSDLEDMSTLDGLAALWDSATKERLVGSQSTPSTARDAFVAAWKARAHEIKAAAAQSDTGTEPAASPQPDADGIVDAELVPEQVAGGADAVWQEILRVAGEQGYSLPDLEDHFAQQMGGLTSAEASTAELQSYLDKLRQAEAVSA